MARVFVNVADGRRQRVNGLRGGGMVVVVVPVALVVAVGRRLDLDFRREPAVGLLEPGADQRFPGSACLLSAYKGRHPGEGRDPLISAPQPVETWIPAFAGMTLEGSLRGKRVRHRG